MLTRIISSGILAVHSAMGREKVIRKLSTSIEKRNISLMAFAHSTGRSTFKQKLVKRYRAAPVCSQLMLECTSKAKYSLEG